MSEKLASLLIPGDADFPPAGDLGIAAAMAAHERFAGPLTAVLGHLPDGFEGAPEAEAIVSLERVEADHPTDFSGLIVGAYSLYYTHPHVAEVIERLTGHTARPPQPAGHALPPFDPALVAVPAARAALYRPTPETET